MKILLALDGSKCSEVALAEVASRLWPEGTEVKVLTAYELPLLPLPDASALAVAYSEETEDAVREEAQEVADLATGKLRNVLGDKVTVTSRLMVGSAKNAIVEEANSWDADLIVVGSHGYRGWQRFWLGSVSQAVVTQAKCSVEVVRCKEAHAQEPAAA